jgi:hypothetical protein
VLFWKGPDLAQGGGASSGQFSSELDQERTASATLMLIRVALNYIIVGRIFVYVTSISLEGSLWTWALIVIAHLGYTARRVAAGTARAVPYRMPGSPYTNWFVVTFLGLVAAMLASRDFKGIRRKRLPIFMLGADHAFQASFERQTPHSPPASSGHELARI